MPPESIPVDVVTDVKRLLGVTFEELLGAMKDLATPPIFLFGDDRTRLADVRARAVACIED